MHHPAVYSTHTKVQIYAANPLVSVIVVCYITVIWLMWYGYSFQNEKHSNTSLQILAFTYRMQNY
jgi:hypothetical protein